jgi:hypothetical protein
VSLAAIKKKGLDTQFDSAQLELAINPTIEQRAVGKLSSGNGAESVQSENLAKPAIFARYVNMRAGADYSSQSFYGADGEPAPASPSMAPRAGTTSSSRAPPPLT